MPNHFNYNHNRKDNEIYQQKIPWGYSWVNGYKENLIHRKPIY